VRSPRAGLNLTLEGASSSREETLVREDA
jgi:hypothetical protein